MKISNTNLSAIPAASSVAHIKPENSTNQKLASTSNDSAQPKTIDMRNISLNEINTLIKAGVDGLLDILPAVPAALNSQNSDAFASDVKVDFIRQLEANIDFKKSMGENVDFLSQVLANIKSLDGMKFPLNINTTA